MYFDHVHALLPPSYSPWDSLAHVHPPPPTLCAHCCYYFFANNLLSLTGADCMHLTGLWESYQQPGRHVTLSQQPFFPARGRTLRAPLTRSPFITRPFISSLAPRVFHSRHLVSMALFPTSTILSLQECPLGRVRQHLCFWNCPFSVSSIPWSCTGGRCFMHPKFIPFYQVSISWYL